MHSQRAHSTPQFFNSLAMHAKVATDLIKNSAFLGSFARLPVQFPQLKTWALLTLGLYGHELIKFCLRTLVFCLLQFSVIQAFTCKPRNPQPSIPQKFSSVTLSVAQLAISHANIPTFHTSRYCSKIILLGSDTS